MSGRICPECRQGKHVNCVEAWDDLLDEPVDCACDHGDAELDPDFERKYRLENPR